MKKLKRHEGKITRKIKAQESSFYENLETCFPLFSLKDLQSTFCLSKCTKEEKSAFADKLHRLSQLTWGQIKQCPRHGLGFEKIKRQAIRAAIPNHITPDIDIIAFRFCNKKAMVGYRKELTFFVVWFDRDFSLYDHG